jgi:hypothetical protein
VSGAEASTNDACKISLVARPSTPLLLPPGAYEREHKDLVFFNPWKTAIRCWNQIPIPKTTYVSVFKCALVTYPLEASLGVAGLDIG